MYFNTLDLYKTKLILLYYRTIGLKYILAFKTIFYNITRPYFITLQDHIL